MKRTWVLFAAAILLAAGVLAPNLLWLSRSSLIVTNQSGEAVSGLTVAVDGTGFDLGEIGPGDTRFSLLPKRGDATLEVIIERDGESLVVCRLYVEGQLYRVAVTLNSADDVSCDESISAIFERLLLRDLLASWF